MVPTHLKLKKLQFGSAASMSAMESSVQVVVSLPKKTANPQEKFPSNWKLLQNSRSRKFGCTLSMLSLLNESSKDRTFVRPDHSAQPLWLREWRQHGAPSNIPIGPMNHHQPSSVCASRTRKGSGLMFDGTDR